MPQTGAKISWETAAVAITAGDTVYRDADTSNKLRKCLKTSAAASNCRGIAVNTAGIDQPCAVCTEGRIYLSDDTLPGNAYAIGSAAGKIDIVGEVGDAEFLAVLGVCREAGYLDIQLDIPGVEVNEAATVITTVVALDGYTTVATFSNNINVADFSPSDFVTGDNQYEALGLAQGGPSTLIITFLVDTTGEPSLNYDGDTPGVVTPQNVNY